MDDNENLKELDGKLYSVFYSFGKDFPVYYQYCDDDGETLPNYMIYETQPQFNEDGQRFVLATQERCKSAAPPAGAESDGNCGGCRYFKTDETQSFSIFGLCTCEEEKRNIETEEEK